MNANYKLLSVPYIPKMNFEEIEKKIVRSKRLMGD